VNGDIILSVKKFLRENFVLVAAFALPGAVAALFLVAMAIPRWTVALPQHDLVMSIERWDSTPSEVFVTFVVRDGRLEADLRPFAKPANPAIGPVYPQKWALLLFDHQAMEVRELPLDLPKSLAEGETRTVPIEALAGRRIVPGGDAPDGYKVSSLNTGSGGGIVGEVFGMNRRYRRGVAVAKSGRTVELELPAPHRETYGTIQTIGWIVDDGRPAQDRQR
jgi:hypothetical protein